MQLQPVPNRLDQVSANTFKLCLDSDQTAFAFLQGALNTKRVIGVNRL